MYKVVFSKQADKDKKLLKAAKLDRKAKDILDLLAENPFRTPPPYEALVGNLHGLYSRRISFQHRIVYDVNVKEKTVHILRMWTHYDMHGK